MEKSHIEIVKFEVENLKLTICVQILEYIKNKAGLRIAYSNQKVWCWVGGWVDGWMDGWVAKLV